MKQYPFARDLAFGLAVWMFSSVSTVHADSLRLGRSYPIKPACTSEERWKLSGSLGASTRQDFKDFLEGDMSDVLGYSLGLELSESSSSEKRVLGLYWAGRALHRVGLLHDSWKYFNAALSVEPSSATSGIQLAALRCLTDIVAEYPSFGFGDGAAAGLARLQNLSLFQLKKVRMLRDLRRGVSLMVRSRLAKGLLDETTDDLLPLLRGGAAYEHLTVGLVAFRKRDFPKAIKHLDKFVKAKQLPSDLEPLREPARLSLGRAFYSLEKWNPSVETLMQVSRESPYVVRAIDELSWVYLMNDDYGKAIGTAFALQGGSMKHAYAPSGIMVMAMAFNEFCQYQSALKVAKQFRRKYKDVSRWLKQWNKNSKKLRKSEDFYRLAIKYLETGETTVPKPVMLEWIRSKVFLANQRELNLFIDEEELHKSFVEEQKEVFSELALKFKRDSGAKNRRDIRARLRALKAASREMRKARKVASSGREQGTLIDEINADITRINKWMHTKLKSTAENMALVEVEIYNGASEDIVWQNNNPRYMDFKEKMKSKDLRSQVANDPWNWGEVVTGDDGSYEMWEDELGSLKATLFDNCASRDKYLTILPKKKRRR